MIATALIGLSSAAHAVPVLDFEIDGANSDVTIISQNSGLICSLTACGVDAELNAGLDGTQFPLAEGQSNTFDFIDWSFSGLGGAIFEVEATLAFAAPLNESVSSSGAGGFITFFGILTAAGLDWSGLPATLALADGSVFDVDFQSGFGIFFGDITTTATVTATKVAAVPLPAALPLLAFAFGGLVLLGRRRRMIA